MGLISDAASEVVGEAVAAGKDGIEVTMGVAVGPPHANPVITSAAIREIDMRIFMSLTDVLI